MKLCPYLGKLKTNLVDNKQVFLELSFTFLQALTSYILPPYSEGFPHSKVTEERRDC